MRKDGTNEVDQVKYVRMGQFLYVDLDAFRVLPEELINVPALYPST